MSQKDKEEIATEALIMNSFHHDNVLSLIGISFDNNGFPILVMPRMNKGSLLDFIKNKDVHLHNHEFLKFGLDVAQGNFTESFMLLLHLAFEILRYGIFIEQEVCSPRSGSEELSARRSHDC